MHELLMPVEIEMTGFRSFAETTLIKFPSVKKGAVLISGRYKDGTTGSGSGKSSILMAMSFALGFCDVPATELKSWYGKKMSVRLRLSDGTSTYDIIRDPKLSLFINGVEYAGTSAGAKEKLDEILKAPPELIKILTYRPQREKGFFLSNSDRENKEFLTKVLGLDSIESASDVFSKQLSDLLIKIQLAEASISQLETSINSSAISESNISEAATAVTDANNRISDIKSNTQALTEARTEIHNIDAELSKFLKIKSEIESAKNQNIQARRNIENYQKEINHLELGKCFTCHQSWNNASELIEKNKTAITSLIQSMKSNIAMINAAEPLLNPEIAQKLSSRKSELYEYIGKISAPLKDAEQSLHSATANYQNMQRMSSLNQGYRRQLEIKKSELNLYKTDADISEHCLNILGRQGFLGNIFDEVLSEIKMRTNDLMAYMPNINTLSVDISSSSVTQSGKVNKKIKVSILKDGLEKSLKSLSGGQLGSTELCADLGVSETIRKRSGSTLGWIALDEAMDGLDINAKIAALDIIKSKVDGLLIVVDHSTEIKESFDTVIEVEYDGKTSYVV